MNSVGVKDAWGKKLTDQRTVSRREVLAVGAVVEE
jgi:hypothetical protein